MSLEFTPEEAEALIAEIRARVRILRDTSDGSYPGYAGEPDSGNFGGSDF